MDKTRSISEQILKRYPQVFSSDFESNKKALEGLAVVSSKQLRNHIAGYLAKALKQDEETVEQVAPEVKA